MLYKYRAKTENGNSHNGEIEASGLQEAGKFLSQKGLIIIDLKEKKSFSWGFFGKNVPLKEKIIFTKELAVMTRAGIPLVRALESLEEQTTNRVLANAIKEINTGVKGGSSLSASLARKKQLFSSLYINMVNAGEKSGRLTETLEKLTAQLEKDYELSSRIKSALIYPALLLAAIIIVLFLVMLLVVPQLKNIFEEMQIPLPMGTKALLFMALFLKKWAIFLLLGMILFILIIKKALASPSVKAGWDIFKLKIPLAGGLAKKIYLARLTRTASTLLGAGIPLLEILTLLADIVDNEVYKKSLKKIAKETEAGVQLSISFKGDPAYPKMVGAMVAVGESSGKLEEVFSTLADFFESDVEVTTRNLTTLLEPILMIIMGVVIGLVVAAVIMPIYGLVNAI